MPVIPTTNMMKLKVIASATTFKSKGYDARLEMVHQPIADWEGVVGVIDNQQKLDITGESCI